MKRNQKKEEGKRDFIIIEKNFTKADEIQNEAIEKEVQKFHEFIKNKQGKSYKTT